MAHLPYGTRHFTDALSGTALNTHRNLDKLSRRQLDAANEFTSQFLIAKP